MTSLIEKFEDIRRRQEELKAQQDMALTGSTLPTEAASGPSRCAKCGSAGMEAYCARIDCPGGITAVYGYGGFCG